MKLRLPKFLQRDSNDGLPMVDLTAANNLFGTIAEKQVPFGTSLGFIPIDGKGGTLNLTDRDGVQWLGLNAKPMQWWAYNYCSPLAAVIDRLAEADTNGKIKIVDSKGVEVKNSNKVPQLARVKKLLAQPNPLQTWEEFNSQQIVLCKIFGYCPVFAITPYGMDKSYTKTLWNMNPYFMVPQFNYDFDLLDNESGQTIKEWIVTIFGKSYNIPAEDVILVKDGFVDNINPNIGLPISKIAGLDYSISNICAAMEADNVLLKKKGPLGVWSYDQKPDMAGQLPMKQSDKDDLQADLQRYGLTWGQLQYVISKASIKWNPMSFNVRDLMTKETTRAAIDNICDRFGYPAELMSGKNATYENRDSAERFMYQNNIIPFSLRRMARFDKFFGLDNSEYNLLLWYNHLPVLQEDIMKSGQAKKALSEGLTLDWQNGLITFDEYRILCDYEPVGGTLGPLYYPQYTELFPLTPQKPANVTAS